MEINNEQFYLLFYLMGLHPPCWRCDYTICSYKYCILINQQQKHSKQSTCLSAWLTDQLIDWQTDSLTDWLLDSLSLSSLWIIFWGHNFSSLSLCSLYVGSSNAIIKKWRHFSCRNMEIKYIYIREKFLSLFCREWVSFGLPWWQASIFCWP